MSLGDMEPRQKMINLMYLVLLCMLAMNVSKEILQSFLIINEGLERTTENFESKIEQTYEVFGRKMADDPAKVGEFYEHAKELKENADEIVELIESIKRKLVQTGDGLPDDAPDSLFSIEHCHSKDNQDIGAQIMIGPDLNNPLGPEEEFSALNLKSKIELFNEHLESFILEKSLVEEMQIPLGQMQEHGMLVNWEIGNFNHLPLAATVTNLTRFQAAVRNSEADALKELMSEIGADDFSFDTLAVKVIPRNGTYISQGDSFKADVIVAAYSTTKNPKLIIGKVDTTGEQVSVIDGDTSNVRFENRGIPTYGVKTSALGEQTWGGVIKILKPNGKWAPYKFEHKYMVATPSLVVSPTKMNVFYKGLENPVEVSVSGMASEKLNVRVQGGGCKVTKKKAGTYEIVPSDKTKDKVVKVIVSSTDPGAKPFKPYEFRLKSVPKPIPFFNGATGSVDMKLSKVRNGKFISAKLEDFLFDLRYRVLGFEMFVSVGGKSSTFKSKSGKLTAQMIKILKSMKPGQTLIFQKVVAQMDRPGAGKVPLNGNIIVHIK
ncbi:MAG: gliding motility protein GldM [Salibacteraceae bacterium]